MSEAIPMNFVPSLAPEDRARADFYALLARLFFAPPDEALLHDLAGAGDLPADDASAALAHAWRALARAGESASEDALLDEFDALFSGVGKSQVSPYLGAYAEKASAENFLAALRTFLDELGLARRDAVNEPEDHLAALCEVMRMLVLEHPADLQLQRDFFTRFLLPGLPGFCDALEASPQAAYYLAVSRFARAFVELERTAFEME